jgi:UDP-N-acetylmuramoylalanine--D-glutamate ligase
VQTLEGQSVLILGLGASGLAMARWCQRAGARVTVADTRPAPPQLAALQADCPGACFIAGPFAPLDAAWLATHEVRAVFRSPGLSPAQVAGIVEPARATGLWVGGELDLFAYALQQLHAQQHYAPKVLAITGTNGKTTTTSLTGMLVECSGQTMAVAGNIGPTLLDTLQQRLDNASLPQVWVLELSSFQLDGSGASAFEPLAATVLNVTQDHLDWHGDMQAYASAKARIFGQQALMLLNRDDPAVMAMQPALVKGRTLRQVVTFGADIPTRPGDWGLETVNGMTWLVRAHEADETGRRRKDAATEIHLQRLMPAEALRIRGRHNATNALAALALAQSTGATLAPMLYGLREYRGEPHRVEPVAIVRDVEYFDDSKGTNVGATVAALKGLGPDRKLVVILGGDGKGQDFSPLAGPLAQYARAVVLIGRDAAQIAQAIAATGLAPHSAATLPEAVQQCAQLAQPGDAVLLSPACASLDMFEHYAHRAQVFVQAVEQLQLDGGLA